MYHFLITKLAGIASIFFVYTRVYLSSIGFTKLPNGSVCHQHTQVFLLVLERGVVLSTLWQTSNQTMQCIHSQPEPLPQMSRCKGHLPTQLPSDFQWSREDKRKGKAASAYTQCYKTVYEIYCESYTHSTPQQYVTSNGQLCALLVVFLFPTILSESQTGFNG